MRSSRTRQDGVGGAPYLCQTHSKIRNTCASRLPDASLLVSVTYSTTASTGRASTPGPYLHCYCADHDWHFTPGAVSAPGRICCRGAGPGDFGADSDLTRYRQHLWLCPVLCNGNRNRCLVRHVQSAAFLFRSADRARLLLRPPAGSPHSDRPHYRTRQSHWRVAWYSRHGFYFRPLRDEERCRAVAEAAGAKNTDAGTARGLSSSTRQSHLRFAVHPSPQSDQRQLRQSDIADGYRAVRV